MSEQFSFAEGQAVVIASYTPKLGRRRGRSDVVGKRALVLFVGGEWGLPDDPAYTVMLEDGERLAVVGSELRAH